MDNMSIYDAVRKTPEEARKKITGGRMNGFTDINPQYRIMRLTEQFGPCGFGWYYEPTRKWTEQLGDETACFVDIDLFIRVGEEWSKPIHGTGGSMLMVKESKGLRASDEGYKMATTDAISVACKQLGIGADVYWDRGESKYTKPIDSKPEAVENNEEAQHELSPKERVESACKVLRITFDTFGDLYKSMQASGEIQAKKAADLTPEEWRDLIPKMQQAVKATKR